MTHAETDKEIDRTKMGAKVIIADREPMDSADVGPIMVTLEGVVAAVLLAVMGSDAQKAVGMLHEGLVPGVEQRLALFASRKKDKPHA